VAIKPKEGRKQVKEASEQAKARKRVSEKN
jgi:hypothetical protein